MAAEEKAADGQIKSLDNQVEQLRREFIKKQQEAPQDEAGAEKRASEIDRLDALSRSKFDQKEKLQAVHNDCMDKLRARCGAENTEIEELVNSIAKKIGP